MKYLDADKIVEMLKDGHRWRESSSGVSRQEYEFMEALETFVKSIESEDRYERERDHSGD